MELVIRCEHGSIIPWVRRLEDGQHTAVAGPDRLTLATPIETHGENLRTVAEFSVHAGEEIPFVLTWSPSFRSIPESADAACTIEEASAGWREWARCYKREGSGEWSEAVLHVRPGPALSTWCAFSPARPAERYRAKILMSVKRSDARELRSRKVLCSD